MTLVIAHRGAHGAGVPENTPAAFERAISLGADMVEFDVRRTPDGGLVVRHDPGGDDGPPLGEVLDRCRGRIGVNLELKEPGYVRQVLSMLYESDALVTSFHDEVIREVRALAPHLRTGILVHTGPPAEALTRSGAHHVILEQSLPLVPGCFVWTVNDAPALEQFLSDPDVLGIITDVPELALELRAGISARTEPVAPS